MSRRITPLAAAVLAAALAAAAWACGDSAGNVEPVDDGGIGQPGLRIVSGAGAADTVLAPLPELLVAELRDGAGRAVRGVIVRFEAELVPQRTPFNTVMVPTARVARPFAQIHQLVVADTTDAVGRAEVRVALGTVAGTGRVFVSVPELGIADTATYTVRPGAAADVVITPRDTAVFIGGAYTPHAAAVDRFGNERSDALTYESLSPAAAMAGDGKVSGRSFGRAALVARLAGGPADTVMASVVPQGEIAAGSSAENGVKTIELLELDGSDRRTVRLATGVAAEICAPTWRPDGAMLAFYGCGYGDRIYVVAPTAGATPSRFLQGSPAVASELWPHYSPDGQWVYFGGDRALWRARADGSGAERIGPPADYYKGDERPSPSPDGRRLVYDTERLASYDWRLRFFDVETRAITTADIPGAMPRWSPSGELIAFSREESLWVMRADGTGQRRLSPAGRRHALGHSWSPDSRYIVVRGEQTLEVFDAATGVMVPLPFGTALSRPAWRP